MLETRMEVAGGAGVSVRSMGPWQATWYRLRRDRWTVAALAALVVVLFLSLFGGAIVSRIEGHSGDDLFPYATKDDPAGRQPVGPLTWVPRTFNTRIDQYGDLLPPPKSTPKTLFVLGGDGILGRDEFIRLLDGGRTSLEIGLGGVIVALLLAVPIGASAGYFGGFLDAIVSRFVETIMAFPMLLFLVFATSKVSPYLAGVNYSWILAKGVFSDAVLIGAFTCFYPMRLIRSQVLVLRQAEFVDSAHMIGASNWRILRRELFPHLVPTLLVWGAIAVATNILLEVSLSFIGVGVQPQTPTWGSMLSQAWGTIYGRGFSTNPTIWQTIFPTAGILVTVVALNQLSEGFRRALEPWSRR
jgi:peptide/nickel transport system permease protein